MTVCLKQYIEWLIKLSLIVRLLLQSDLNFNWKELLVLFRIWYAISLFIMLAKEKTGVDLAIHNNYKLQATNIRK